MFFAYLMSFMLGDFCVFTYLFTKNCVHVFVCHTTL